MILRLLGGGRRHLGMILGFLRGVDGRCGVVLRIQGRTVGGVGMAQRLLPGGFGRRRMA